MQIDLRKTPVKWINLDHHKANAREMREQCRQLEMANNERVPGVVHEKHHIGVGSAHLDCFDLAKNHLPMLIMEDDCFATPHYRPIIEVPNGTDAIYLGISTAGERKKAIDIGNGLARVSDILAAHAIVYTSDRYLKAIQQITRLCLFTNDIAFDIGTAYLQRHFLVIAPHNPFFYQSDDRESANKWQHVTDGQLPIAPPNPAISNPPAPGDGFGPMDVTRSYHCVAKAMLEFGGPEQFAEWLREAWTVGDRASVLKTLIECAPRCSKEDYFTLLQGLCQINVTPELLQIVLAVANTADADDVDFLRFVRDLMANPDDA